MTLQEQYSGTRSVLDAHRFDVLPLQHLLQERLTGFSGPITVRQFRGGQSNPTYLLETKDASYVLRRKPPGNLLKSAHAVDREFRVLSALYEAGFPVPEPYLLCEDDSIIGTTFFVMEYVAGRIFWDLSLPTLTPVERRAIYDDVNRTISKLHSLDVSTLQLEDFGKPGNYFARQVSRWSQQYIASSTRPIPEMDKLMAWLPAHIPDDERVAVVHGDFRLDNIVIHPQKPKVIAVLDWELSTTGSALGDFTYHLMAWQMPDVGIGSSGLRDFDLEALGIPGEDDYVSQYCRRTGQTVDAEARDFYSAYNFFRIAAISQGIAGRVRDGTAASVFAKRAAEAVQPLAAMGLSFIA